MKRAIMIHGCPDTNEPRDPEKRTYEKHWRLWIKDTLEKRGIKVSIPLMPEPWLPDYKKWEEEFEKLEVDEDTTLIGHSCGCAFLVRWLGESGKKIKKLVLVAPWKIASRENGSDKNFYEYSINPRIKENVGEIIMFTSDNEEEDGKKSLKIYNESLGGKVIELKRHGHYTMGDMGTTEFPELLDEVVR